MVDLIAGGTTPQNVVAFRPSEEARRRVWDLVAKQKSSGLDAEESSELEHYLQLEHIMRLAKARAQRNLDRAS